MKRVLLVLLVVVGLATILAACGGPNGAAPNPPSITSFKDNPTTITSGQSTTLSWTVTGTTPITLSINNGIGTVTGSSITVSPTTTTTYTLTATNSAGSTSKQVTVTVNGTTPSITSFQASPNPVALNNATTFTWVIGNPGGTLTCTLDPGDGTRPLTVSDCSNTTSQTYTYASAAGSPYTATLIIQGKSASKATNVVVTAHSGTTVKVTEQGATPWIAWQDGSGAWQTLSGTSFNVTDAGGRYGVAYACTIGTGSLVEVIQATTNDTTTIATSCQYTTPPTRFTYTGTISGLSPGGQATLEIGDTGSQVSVGSSATSATYSNGGVPVGVHTAAVFSMDASGNLLKYIIQPNIDVTSNGTLDFDLASGTAPSYNSLNVTGVPSGETATSKAMLFVDPDYIDLPGSISTNYVAIPAGLKPAGSIYDLIANASDPSTITGPSQSVALWQTNPSSSESLALPTAMGAGATVAASGSTATATWTPVTFPTSGGTTLYGAAVIFNSCSGNTCSTDESWVAFVTKSWAGTSTTYTLPDFSSTANWNTSWNFPTGRAGQGSVSAMHTNLTWPQLGPLLNVSNRMFAPPSFPDGSRFEGSAMAVAGTY